MIKVGFAVVPIILQVL